MTNTTKIRPKYTIDPSDYRKAIENEQDFYIQFKSTSNEVDAIITKIIFRYLEQYDIQYLKDTLLNIVKELTNNAIKANLKRIYFSLNDLDIAKTDDYRKGMENFKEDTYQSDSDRIFKKLEKSNLVVRISFKTTDDHIHINIINNIPILDAELKKIEGRMKKANKYDDISVAFHDVLDDSEGAGLGLIMTTMLLKSCGLPVDTFKIYKKNNLTIASLSIPKNYTNIESQIKIADEILKELEEIPTIPENIKIIQKHISNPEATIKEIAGSISRDPGLTASILKLANSAGYITSSKVETIADAVKLIGMKGINTLLIATGVHKILDTRYTKFEKIWNESNKKAHYAQKIAMELKLPKLSEFAYLSGLLADIGYIILFTLRSDLIKRLQEIAGIKGIHESILLEEISLGTSHSSLGAMICKKWKFNEALVQTIEYHHRPYMSPDKYKNLIYIVYLANCFIEIENKTLRFEIINEAVLEHFNLIEKVQFEKLHRKAVLSYQHQTEQYGLNGAEKYSAV